MQRLYPGHREMVDQLYVSNRVPEPGLCISCYSEIHEAESGPRRSMLIKRAEVLATHPEVAEAAELAPLMGEHKQEYWSWKLDSYFASQGV